MTQIRPRTPAAVPAAVSALTLAFAFVFPVVTPLGAQGAPSRFAVAVMRADGILIPFAAFDDGRWRAMWSGVERGRYDVPVSLPDIDEDWWRDLGPISTWRHVTPAGEAREVAVTGVRLVATPCDGDVGLQTDFQAGADLPPERTAPYPKVGLATSVPVDVTPFVPLRPETSAWREAHEGMAEAFDDLETRQLVSMRWSHPVSPRERRETPIELKAALHVPGSRFVYVEAMRRYPDPNPPADAPPCPLVTYVQGFLWRNDRGRFEPVSMTTLVSYCHLEEAMYVWPLGAIERDGRRYWLAQLGGWTAEAYGVLELDEDKGAVRERVWHMAGQCGRR